TPMLCSRWYRRGEDMEHPTGRFAIWFERGFARVENGYRNALEWALTHRWFVFISGFCVLVAVFFFIGGSMAADIPGAVKMGMQSGFAAALAIGLAVFGYNFAKNTFSLEVKRVGARFLVALGALVLVGMAAMGMWPMGILMAIIVPMIVPFLFI